MVVPVERSALALQQLLRGGHPLHRPQQQVLVVSEHEQYVWGARR